MKKIIISAIFSAAFFSGAAAQQIANGNFENWTTQTLYEDPNGYLSTNGWTYTSLPGGNVIKVTPAYHAQYAVQLTTIQTQTDTMFGGLFIGTPGNQTIDGGIPYTGQPDSISVYVKYNIMPNDTAFFIVAFKNSGSIIGMAVKTFTGSQSTYQRVCIPTNLPVSPAPDSLVAIFSSSNLDPPRFPGSTLTLDSITMIGTTQAFPNPSFENWTPLVTEEPDNWATINYAKTSVASSTKSTSSYSGTYALRLETIQTSWGDTSGYITNGYMGPSGPAGGMQVFANPSKITGYYKYFPVGNDTALGGAFSYINSGLVDSNIVYLTAKNTYTYFEIPLYYTGWPFIDTLNIIFTSSNMIDSSYVGLGSVLFIDDLTVLYNPVSVNSPDNSFSHSVYPNPFSNSAIISLPNIQGNNYDFVMYDMLGNAVMKKENSSSNSIVIDRNNLPAGIYNYKITLRSTSNIIATGKVAVQ
ncbi:MAG: T9SS type A sorting domain-containing protein [Bacteroidetes bacterium]|nr:T9SS type A sorting domain-containing protein [Bacteroidota bacterium]